MSSDKARVPAPVPAQNARGKLGFQRRFVFYWRRYVVDAASWAVAIILATVIRFDGFLHRADWEAVGQLILMAVVLQLVLGYILAVYRGRHPWGSFEGFLDVLSTTILAAAIMWAWSLFMPGFAQVPRSLVLIATPFAIICMAGSRYLVRLGIQRYSRPAREGTPVLLYGAGYVGDHLARLLTTDSKSNLVPVGILDDDRSKRHLRLHGVDVAGSLEDLPQIVEKTGAEVLIISVGDPSPELLARVHELSKDLQIRVQVMPPTAEMLKTGVQTSDLRDLDIEDLLGRAQVDTDVSAIAGYLNSKRVLVTGAGGSIGQQLCIEINKHGPAELILLDRDETGLQHTEIQLRGNGLLDSKEVVLADIRDTETLKKIFNNRKPDVVFHAAALKHLPMLEQYPDEAWQTNVLGTLNVLEAAKEAGVEVLINISTDKAANPTSVLGMSKRIAERLTAWEGNEAGLRYLSVRFGNVIGSRGSMLPTFRSLIEEGKPLTVTHPDITRYFMTIPEACQLVLQAGAIGRVGEVLILDMGEPVKILDIANKMIALSGKDIPIIYTGLREGEKLHEDLHGEAEQESSPLHEKVTHAAVVELNPERLSSVAWADLVDVPPTDRPGEMRQRERRAASTRAPVSTTGAGEHSRGAVLS